MDVEHRHLDRVRCRLAAPHHHVEGGVEALALAGGDVDQFGNDLLVQRPRHELGVTEHRQPFLGPEGEMAEPHALVEQRQQGIEVGTPFLGHPQVEGAGEVNGAEVLGIGEVQVERCTTRRECPPTSRSRCGGRSPTRWWATKSSITSMGFSDGGGRFEEVGRLHLSDAPSHGPGHPGGGPGGGMEGRRFGPGGTDSQSCGGCPPLTQQVACHRRVNRCKSAMIQGKRNFGGQGDGAGRRDKGLRRPGRRGLPGPPRLLGEGRQDHLSAGDSGARLKGRGFPFGISPLLVLSRGREAAWSQDLSPDRLGIRRGGGSGR